MPSYAIGVDLGGTNLRIAAVNENGTLLEKTTLGTEVARGRDVVLDSMTAAIQALAAKHSRDGKLLGIGIGIPGIIDMATGLLRESPNLPGWSDYPVGSEIERRLGMPVVLENDANVAALGEKWQGGAREYDDMCMLTLGTGVGGGLVLNGKVWHGMNGMAGEVGHITVEPDGFLCGCGNRGCIECYASATAVVRMAREMIASGEAPELARAAEGHDAEFSSKFVFNLAMQGDRAAQKIFERVGRTLGVCIADIINMLNLPIVLLGGGVSHGWEAFAPAMFAELRQRSFVYAATAPEADSRQPRRTMVTRALLGGDAGLYGAARLPMISSKAL